MAIDSKAASQSGLSKAAAAVLPGRDVPARQTPVAQAEHAALKMTRQEQQQSCPAMSGIYQDFFWRSAQACLILDAAGTILQANPAAAAMLGQQADAMPGQAMAGLVWQEQAVLQEEMDQTLSTGQPVSCEVRCMKADRELILLQLALSRTAMDGQAPLLMVIMSDVTQRPGKSMNQPESQYFASVVAENVPDMVAYWNTDLRCTYANHQYLTWFGRSPEQMQNISLQELLGEELFSKNIAYIQGVLKGVNQQFERSLVKANGDIGYVWAQYIAHKVDGVTQGFFALATDVTLLKRAQVALIKSEAKNRAMLRAIPDLIFTISRNGDFLDVHASSQLMLQESKDQFLLSKVADMLPPAVASQYMQAVALTLDSGKLQEFRYSMHDMERGEMQFEARVAFCTHDTVIVIVRDITETERERRQRELQLSERLQIRENDLRDMQLSLTMVSDVTHIGTWIGDARSGELWASLQWRKLFGFSEDVALNLADILQRIHPADRQAVSDMMKTDYSREQSRHHVEFRVLLPDGFSGKACWMAAVWQVEFDEHQQALLHRGVAVDISARKEAELELGQKRMEVMHLGRVATMGELSGALAHELNQPLTAILSNAQAAQRFLTRPELDRQVLGEILQDIVDEDKRAGEIIRRLRRLFDKQASVQHSVDINQLVQEVLHILRNDMVNQGMTLLCALQDGLPAISADPVQLQQVLINLIMNACDVVAGLDASQRIIEIHSTMTGTQQIQVKVDDHGPGIPDALQTRIFEPFYTTKAHGMGLGLSICKNIVEATGGQLWCENRQTTEGKPGASFHFTLPVSKGVLS
ncbi:PAS domain-containing sensor histidine kinase [Undibacterium sp. Di27W]|uniref:PAS domain-containing sensor histidine kinase n=1 Tax=Undibacterium sp. Di27W TaxID=3413036 RepID=UPI003BEF4DDF